jgi:bacterioferritin-associated ferredoxin
MIVCLCEGISDREIRRTIRSGANTLAKVSNACGAGTGCGTCKRTIVDILLAAEDKPTVRSSGIFIRPLVPFAVAG